MDDVGETPEWRAAAKEPELPWLQTSHTLVTIAASIFLVSGAWWCELPSSGSPARVPAGQPPALATDWERAAFTLRCEPSQEVIERAIDRRPSTRRYALSVDWMLDGVMDPR
jgi:hypothetical protein